MNTSTPEVIIINKLTKDWEFIELLFSMIIRSFFHLIKYKEEKDK